MLAIEALALQTIHAGYVCEQAGYRLAGEPSLLVADASEVRVRSGSRLQCQAFMLTYCWELPECHETSCIYRLHAFALKTRKREAC